MILPLSPEDKKIYYCYEVEEQVFSDLEKVSHIRIDE